MVTILGTVISSPDSEFLIPVIRVHLFKGPTYVPGSGMPQFFARDTVAMLDTGSSNGALDNTVFAKGDLQLLRQGSANVVDRATPVDIYPCGIFEPTTNSIFVGSFIKADLKRTNVPYDLILGSEFLKYYELRIALKRGLVELTSLQ